MRSFCYFIRLSALYTFVFLLSLLEHAVFAVPINFINATGKSLEEIWYKKYIIFSELILLS